MEKGKVYLVGAGPGDPGLITVKGLQLLHRAEVIIYDQLASPDLLTAARPEAQLIYVGKKAGAHALPQEDINRLLIDKAREGKTVVRLKGGDPFVFGRGGEEAEALAAAGIPFEVVPGVTAAVAVPACAGIPVTHRGLASLVTLVTGHEDPAKPESAIPWDILARTQGTLVFLMGVKNLAENCRRLLEGGRAPHTPAAVIQSGTLPDQRTVTGTLADIAAKAREADLRPPAVLVVGEVVALRERLNWWETRPLWGRVAVVTRTREQASALVELLAEAGARCLEVPTLEILPPEDFSPLDAALERLPEYDWIIFTSANGVKAFMARLFDRKLDVRALGQAKLAAIG
ncbi:MAG: uroporphyrinogen-III C-methyltransferase, partial [Deltaproteobacteria bacterium]|nr:uroporphyrinogen-III C-methyltransferase [Deltaproteobacteria bacterium]